MNEDDPRDPSLERLLGTFAESIGKGIRVALPGRITAYDPVKQLASALPLIMEAHVDEDQQRVAKPLGEVHGCPVAFPGTPRGRLTWPVRVGDLCEIRFQSASIARWVLRGDGPIDPGDDRRHDPAVMPDAIVAVGLHDAAHVPTSAPVDAVVLHAGDGVTVLLGGDDADGDVVVQSALDAYMVALDAGIAEAVAGDGGHAALSAIKTHLGAWAAGTTKVKAK